MKISEYIKYLINRFPKGYVFTYGDFPDKVNQKEGVIKALNRLASSGKIVKLSKGKYYKPENSVFGDLQPSQSQIVKDLLEENGKIAGYLTGYSIYNQLGLTTQVSSVIQIGKNQVRPNFTRGDYRISFLRQKNTITKESISSLQLLDSIRTIKEIPDSDIENSCKRFLAIIKKFSDKQINELVRLALKYPPCTRALLGAMLEELQKNKATEPLFKSLNPITKYKLAGAAKVLSTARKWNIL
jgi:hypothetical protein